MGILWIFRKCYYRQSSFHKMRALPPLDWLHFEWWETFCPMASSLSLQPSSLQLMTYFLSLWALQDFFIRNVGLDFKILVEQASCWSLIFLLQVTSFESNSVSHFPCEIFGLYYDGLFVHSGYIFFIHSTPISSQVFDYLLCVRVSDFVCGFSWEFPPLCSCMLRRMFYDSCNIFYVFYKYLRCKCM